MIHLRFVDTEKTFCGRVPNSEKLEATLTNPEAKLCKVCDRIAPKHLDSYFGLAFVEGRWRFKRPKFVFTVEKITVVPLAAEG